MVAESIIRALPAWASSSDCIALIDELALVPVETVYDTRPGACCSIAEHRCYQRYLEAEDAIARERYFRRLQESDFRNNSGLYSRPMFAPGFPADWYQLNLDLKD